MDSNVGWAKLTYLIETYRIDYIAHPTGLIKHLVVFQLIDWLILDQRVPRFVS